MEKKRKINKRVVINKKDRTTAIILAIFFGLFAWLYTYKFDKAKFWANLILVLVTAGIWGIVAWIWVIIDMATKDKDKFENYHKWVVK